MLNYKLTEDEKITKYGKIQLYKTKPFFAYLLMFLNIQEKTSKSNPTMCVNQYGDLYWNRDFVKELTPEQIQGVLCHEVMHIATLTLQRMGLRDIGLWNVATDLVINFLLTREGMQLPKGCLLADHRGIYTSVSGKTGKKFTIDLNDKCSEQVYAELAKNAKIVKENLNIDGQGNYDGAIDKHLQGDKDSDGNSTGKDKKSNAQQINESEWKKKIAEAVTQAKNRGTMSGAMERMFEGILDPVVDWRTKLYKYITNEIPIDYSMKVPSRRFFSTGNYTPTTLKENLNVVIGVDVSGSISEVEYKDFLSECYGIANSFGQVKMRLLAWGTEVHEKDDFEITSHNKEALYNIKFHGGGGTELSSMTRYCEKKNIKSRIYVILTDGYIESTPKLPANANCLFVLSKNGSSEIVKKFGEVCNLADGQY